MSTLQGSRWAATPPADDPSQKELPVASFESRWAATPPADEPAVVEHVRKESGSGLMASRWAATPPVPEVVPQDDDATERAAKDTGVGEGGDQGTGALAIESEMDRGLSGTKQGLHAPITRVEENPMQVEESKGERLPQLTVHEPANDAKTPNEVATGLGSPTKFRLNAPRLKKKVSWRGKACVIQIPNIDYEALGLAKPLSLSEVQARLEALDEQGFNTDGFDFPAELGIDDGPVHVKPIYPDEVESPTTFHSGPPKVSLPDLKRWKAYEDWLTEQKLAALGVSIGPEELAAAPAQDMSRQSSGQYPPLPFSPPLPSASVGSAGRPGMIRGHSHHMSVASPISPLNGPFGHMHRHSTFTGSLGYQPVQQAPQQPSNLNMRAFSPLGQHPVQQSPVPDMQSFSPQPQLSIPAFNRTGSPAQPDALRNYLGNIFGSGSPLQQHAVPQSPQQYSQSLAADHMRRQHGYSQSMQQPPIPSAFAPDRVNNLPTPALPELPEEDDEEELEEEHEVKPAPESDSSAYVPPHKRAQLNANIAVPTPRGHRHNISEGLERDILDAEDRRESKSRDWIEVEEEESEDRTTTDDNAQRPKHESKSSREMHIAERDPLAQDYPVQESVHSHKKSASRFNVAAPAFKFNPGASFQPTTTAFTFGAPSQVSEDEKSLSHSRQQSSITNGHRSVGHSRHQSSGAFNVAAPVFRPSGSQSIPKSEFSFSTGGPSFKPNVPSFEPRQKQDQTTDDEAPGIFGKVEIPDIVKPARRSKAVAIVRPESQRKSESITEFEDEEGRLAQGDDRLKRQRKFDDDGDEVPRFAEPSPMPAPADRILQSHRPEDEKNADHPGEDEKETSDVLREAVKTDDINDDVLQSPAAETSRPPLSIVPPTSRRHKPSSSLSALAKPFNPFASDNDDAMAHKHTRNQSDSSELEEGEIREDGHPETSPLRDQGQHGFAHTPAESRYPFEQPPSARVDNFTALEPSFDEIDAVMRRLNEADAIPGAQNDAEISPLPSPGAHPMQGVTYLPGDWTRSNVPSPSPKRQPSNINPQADSSFTVHEQADSVGSPRIDGWPHVHINRLNKASDMPVSDWSGEFSAHDEEKLEQRGQFFNDHIDSLIDRVVERRLQPLEDSLRSIHSTVNKRPTSRDLALKRSSSNIESDADDEDDLSEEQRHRPISRGRDKRMDQMKAAILEALREQSPRRQSQSAYDLQELHSVLADMKMSFARAASSSLELEDIRGVLEDVVSKQSQAVVPIALDEGDKQGSHKRELSELEGRLNETLAGALEEANLRRSSEEREAETKRMLRLAEEELQLLRDSNRDDDARLQAAESQHDDLVSRLEKAESAQRDMAEQIQGLEEENEASRATLEEYRMSSHKWRQDIDHSTREREQLENSLNSLRRQLEDSQETGGSMRRRLEKLHSDMATAAGQLTSEKASWKEKEERQLAEYVHLETRNASYVKEVSLLEEEVRVLRSSSTQASESQVELEKVRSSNASLEELVSNLKKDMGEQQTLAALHQRELHDAQEAARAEVHRIRLDLEAEAETANHRAKLGRTELESELSRVRSDLENVKMESETAKEHNARLLEEEENAKREALRKVNHTNSVALDEARQKHEASMMELQQAHDRALSHAIEDKQRSEHFLNERLNLSDSKLQHFQDRVLHLEDRLEIAKSAAQAAAMSAQAKAAVPPAAVANAIPEKISPQALRESILVLQEQLQERESQIDQLQNQVNTEGPVELKKRDDEIAWLRELLAVRNEELTELVNTLAKPTFDRGAVRDTAIRIRASLQMEQQEKERLSQDPQSIPGQGLASLSNFMPPQAAQLSSAFSKWRSNMESSALKNAPRGRGRPQGSAWPIASPSKPPASSSALPRGYMSGLMTPPPTNMRNTPSPEATASLPPPRQHSRPTSKSNDIALSEPPKQKARQASAASETPTTPLFRSQGYDQDAEDNQVQMQSFDDEDLDVADSEPPAFRSLEAELEGATEDDIVA